MDNRKALDEAIKYLSFSMEVVDKIRKNNKKNSSKEVFTDLTHGMSALEVSLNYFQIAYDQLKKEEQEKRLADNEEEN